MNSWLRYFFLFIVVVFLQVTIGNNIHLLGVAIPFLYIYFIIRLPLSLSVNWTFTLAFILGLVIDIFSNTPGMNALACTVVAFLRKPILNLYTPRAIEVT
jgi:rod shape-determining protein MreD